MKTGSRLIAQYALTILFFGGCIHSFSVKAENNTDTQIPRAMVNSLERNQIPLNAISIAVTEIEPSKPGKHQGKAILGWRESESMNPASTMKVLTTLAGLDSLGPQ